jgi:hypothetical protein
MPFSGSVVFSGQGAVSRRIPSTFKKFEEAGGRSMLQIARAIMAESRKIVPVLTGQLRASGYVVQVPLASGGVSIQMGYIAPHALWIHENLTLFHPNGQAKYLEIPFRLAYRTVKAQLAADIRRQMH